MQGHDWCTHRLCARLPTYTFTSQHSSLLLCHAQLSIITVVPHTVPPLLAYDLHFWTCTLRCRVVSTSSPAAVVIVVVMVVMMKHCFGQGTVGGEEGADELNTLSQLETKERPANGPIAESWLTPQCMSLSLSHTQSFTDPLLCFIFFLSHPKPASFLSSHPFCHFLYASCLVYSHIPSDTPPCMCMNVQSVSRWSV